ncbi:MAG: hypothetical protein ACJAU9_001318, partial [Lentimonas sp.]
MIVGLSCIEVAARIPTRRRLQARPTDDVKGKRRDRFKAIILSCWVPRMKYLSTAASLGRNRRVKQFTVVSFKECA